MSWVSPSRLRNLRGYIRSKISSQKAACGGSLHEGLGLKYSDMLLPQQMPQVPKTPVLRNRTIMTENIDIQESMGVLGIQSDGELSPDHSEQKAMLYQQQQLAGASMFRRYQSLQPKNNPSSDSASKKDNESYDEQNTPKLSSTPKKSPPAENSFSEIVAALPQQ